MPTCSCIRGEHYDFRVESCEKTRFFYTDLSLWMTDEPYVIPESYVVKIIPPGKSEGIAVNVKPLSTTTINASDLGANTLEDGVYCFSVEQDTQPGCGKSYKRSKALFPKIQCCLDKAFSKESDAKYDGLKDVEKYLEFAKNESELGNSKKAAENYKIAKKKLDRLNCDCGC